MYVIRRNSGEKIDVRHIESGETFQLTIMGDRVEVVFDDPHHRFRITRPEAPQSVEGASRG